MHYGSKYNQHLFTLVPYSLRYQYAFICRQKVICVYMFVYIQTLNRARGLFQI